MAVAASLPQIGTIVITALVDSINPCAIGVLILLISLMVGFKARGKLLTYGIAYIASIFSTYIPLFLFLYIFELAFLWIV